MKKILIFCILITTLMTSVCFPSAEEAGLPDTMRIGIYYGSGEVETLTLQSSVGFSAGFSTGRDFYPVEIFPENTSVTVSAYSQGSWHLLYSQHKTFEELNHSLSSLRAMGINAFSAYYDSMYCAFGGNFANENDAKWQGENGQAGGKPVTFSSNALCIKDTEKGNILFVSDHSGRSIAVFNAERENPDSLITISGAASGTYRGGFECKAASSQKLTVVNIIPVESYLYSVVCREMSPSWPIEALKVQAVCARNFALGRINYHKQYGFDLCRTVCCQAYSTQADMSESVHEAVDGTRGQLLYYEDDLVQAVYSSSMGSSTENVKNVWGSSFPYLVSVENPYEDTENIYNGKWTKTLSPKRATEIMANAGFSVGDVIEITALEYSDAGRVLKLLVKGTAGEEIFQRERCRTIFSEATYSQKYTVSKGGTTTYPVIKVLAGDKVQDKTLTTISVLSGNNKVSSVSENFVISDGTTLKKLYSTKTDADPNTFVFSGEGWGHGVGMSQYGAKGMAEAGFDYEDILTHYYSGTHLEQVY